MSSATGIESRQLPEIVSRPFSRWERFQSALGIRSQRYLQRSLFEAHVHFRRLFYITPRTVIVDGEFWKLKTIPYVELRAPHPDGEIAIFLSINDEKGAAIFEKDDFYYRGKHFRDRANLFLRAAKLKLSISDPGTE